AQQLPESTGIATTARVAGDLTFFHGIKILPALLVVFDSKRKSMIYRDLTPNLLWRPSTRPVKDTSSADSHRPAKARKKKRLR
ncbi:hypothetical protein, partial [Thiolapillus sp.]